MNNQQGAGRVREGDVPPPSRSAKAFFLGGGGGGSRSWRTDYLSILKALKWGERKFIHRKCFISSKTCILVYVWCCVIWSKL